MKYETEKVEALMERIADRNVAEAIDNKRILEVNNGKCQVVKATEFEAEMKRSGIAYPECFITRREWLKPIADKVLPKYNRIVKRRWGK